MDKKETTEATTKKNTRHGGKWWWNSYNSCAGWYVQCINPFCPMTGEEAAYRPIGIIVDSIVLACAAGVIGGIAAAVKR